MNPFAVEWEPAAEQELARYWLMADDPAALTAAQAQADRLLARDPLQHGRALSEGLFTLTVPPLKLFYTVDAARRVVEVTDVHYIP